jgi:purine-cytosine permease-like protein
MSSMAPPPPEPGKAPSFTPPLQPSSTPPINGVPRGPVRKFNPEDIEKASALPVVLALFAILFSVAVWIFNRHSSVLLSGIGYALAPFVVILCLGFDNFLQRRKTSKGDWFVPNQNFGRVLRFLAGLALILSYPHISGLADHISAWLAQTFPWMA